MRKVERLIREGTSGLGRRVSNIQRHVSLLRLGGQFTHGRLYDSGVGSDNPYGAEAATRDTIGE